ncbi:MAG: hypothetical protein WCJ57_00105 [Candidatus Falkowbacteria bacterium]
MFKLSSKLSAILFCSSVIIITSLSVLLVSTSRKIVLINEALAMELNSVNSPHLVSDKTVKQEMVDEKNFINCDCEKTFTGEKDITINSQVIAAFVSGTDLGVKNLDKNAEYRQFYVDAAGMYQGEIGGKIKISGKLIGITCAYANSVFGECVPEIEAGKIEEIK